MSPRHVLRPEVQCEGLVTNQVIDFMYELQADRFFYHRIFPYGPDDFDHGCPRRLIAKKELSPL